MRDPMYRLLELRVLPGPATVCGDFHSADGTLTGLGQTGDLVKSGTREGLPTGGTGDY